MSGISQLMTLTRRTKFMNRLAVLTAGLILTVASNHAGAVVVSQPGLSQVNVSQVQLVQDKPKSGTVSQRVKRAWKNLVGYTFDVACPIPIPFSHGTCSETGKNPFCYVTEARSR
jgi:hypothetical protein